MCCVFLGCWERGFSAVLAFSQGPAGWMGCGVASPSLKTGGKGFLLCLPAPIEVPILTSGNLWQRRWAWTADKSPRANVVT